MVNFLKKISPSDERILILEMQMINVSILIFKIWKILKAKEVVLICIWLPLEDLLLFTPTLFPPLFSFGNLLWKATCFG